MKQLFILFTIGFFGIACTNSRSQQDAKLDLASIQDTIPYQIDTFLVISPYFQQVDDKLDSTFFRITYPSFLDSTMQRLLFRSVMEDDETLESLGESFLTGYQNYVEEALYPEHIHSWFHEMNLSLPLYMPNIAVLNKSFAEYTGGAHGNYATLYHNYDLRDHSEIPLSKLLNPNKKKEFLNIAEKYFREAEGLSENASLENNYFFDDGIFSMTDNYALDRNGLRFHYNIYEIKAYAEGTTDFVVPYDQLQGLLSKYGQDLAEHIQTHY